MNLIEELEKLRNKVKNHCIEHHLGKEEVTGYKWGDCEICTEIVDWIDEIIAIVKKRMLSKEEEYRLWIVGKEGRKELQKKLKALTVKEAK